MKCLPHILSGILISFCTLSPLAGIEEKKAEEEEGPTVFPFIRPTTTERLERRDIERERRIEQRRETSRGGTFDIRREEREERRAEQEAIRERTRQERSRPLRDR